MGLHDTLESMTTCLRSLQSIGEQHLLCPSTHLTDLGRMATTQNTFGLLLGEDLQPAGGSRRNKKKGRSKKKDVAGATARFLHRIVTCSLGLKVSSLLAWGGCG